MPKRTKMLVAVLTLAALGSVLAATAGGTRGRSTAAGPLKIGVSLSLSGDFSDPGKAVKRGYDLWVAYVNAHGGVLGRKVQMKIVDDASSPNQVVSNYQNLITRDKVDLVFGPFSSLLTGPAATVANRYKYAFLEPAGGGPKVFALHLHNLFFVQPAPVVKCGVPFVEYIASLPKSQRPKTAAYPSLDDPFASTHHARISREGRVVVIEDLGSTNGTYLNDQPLDGPQPLHDGDRIRIGDSEFSYFQ